MYTIDFYETRDGNCDILDFLDTLRAKAGMVKDARIQYGQAARYIQLLQENGFNLPTDIAKFREDDIWELRPGKNRIFFFCFEDGVFVLLHHFRKKSQKTPRREIKKAKAERKDYIAQKEAGNDLG